jgi:hypothetical protein
LQLTLLASRTDGLAADHPFDRTIIIPEAFLVPNDGKSQKLTRTLAYHLTPYLLTLAVDLDTFNCADLMPTLSAIYNDSFSQGRPAPFTIAAAGHDARECKWCAPSELRQPREAIADSRMHGCRHPDNGIKLMWWSAELQEVLWAWEESQLQLGIASSDQRALMEAVKREPQREWRFGRLPRALSVRVRPGLNESFSFAWAERRFSQSLPFIGPLLILHMAGIDRFSAELCALANEGDVGAPRAIALRHMSYFPTRETWRQAFIIVHSQQECEAAMQGGCLLHLHWGREELAQEVTPVLPSEYEY